MRKAEIWGICCVVLCVNVLGYGASAILSDNWYDQDKYHLSTETLSGDSWGHNWFYDYNWDGQHDPGELASEYYWYGYTYAEDNSCWLASASNLVRYVGGGDWYYVWGYSAGVWDPTTFTIKTFDEGGDPKVAIESLGYNAIQISGWSGWSVSPEWWIYDRLNTGTPVSVGVYNENIGLAHALTVYAIDTSARTITIADSDQDFGYTYSPEDFKTVSYYWNGSEFKVHYSDSSSWDTVKSATCIDTTGQVTYWYGAGTNGDDSTTGTSTMWTNPANWSIGHAPMLNDQVYLATTNGGKISIDCEAKADLIYMSGPAEIELTNSIKANTLTLDSNFNHSGLAICKLGVLNVGYQTDKFVVYVLGGGLLSANNEWLGDYGKGGILQTGGSNITPQLVLGYEQAGEGVYELRDGSLTVSSEEVIGYKGVGVFIQSGGSHYVWNTITIGSDYTGIGSYQISGGSLKAYNVYIGYNGAGAFRIEDASADVHISHLLEIGVNAEIKAVEGSVIYMEGADFIITGPTNTANLDDLKNITFVFDNGGSFPDLFELAGVDMGPSLAGLENNFALGTLILGSEESIGYLKLVDQYYNNVGYYEDEVLYLYNLIIGPDSHLDLNGGTIYYLTANIDPLAVIDYNGGELIQIPEPMGLYLLLIGLGVFVRRKKLFYFNN